MQVDFSHTVTSSQAGERLDRLLVQSVRLSDNPAVRALTRQRIQALIFEGHVAVLPRRTDGGRARPVCAAQKLRADDEVTLALPMATPSLTPAVAMPLVVVYEDDDIIVLNKAAHDVVHPGAGTKGPTLVSGLLAHCTTLSGIGGVMRPGIVHRLDAPTTGLIVMAKHDAAHVHLTAQFAARKVHKRYLALICRAPLSYKDRRLLPREGAGAGWHRWEAPIGRHARDRKRFTARPPFAAAPRLASTAWRVLGSDASLLLVGLVLGTGRTHQIRVHAADSIGPVLGDALYRPDVARRPLTAGSHSHLLAQLNHHALHAQLLAFEHPTSHRQLVFCVPPPSSWLKTACTLGPALAWCDGQTGPIVGAGLSENSIEPSTHHQPHS